MDVTTRRKSQQLWKLWNCSKTFPLWNDILSYIVGRSQKLESTAWSSVCVLDDSIEEFSISASGTLHHHSKASDLLTNFREKTFCRLDCTSSTCIELQANQFCAIKLLLISIVLRRKTRAPIRFTDVNCLLPAMSSGLWNRLSGSFTKIFWRINFEYFYPEMLTIGGSLAIHPPSLAMLLLVAHADQQIFVGCLRFKSVLKKSSLNLHFVDILWRKVFHLKSLCSIDFPIPRTAISTNAF